jgi:hypothetical protein
MRAAVLASRWVAASVETRSPAAHAPGTSAIRDHFEQHTHGPGVQKWIHYLDIYPRHLGKFVGKQPVVVEVGVQSGGSLSMWHGYFGAGCRVHGVDIDPGCKDFAGAGTTIHLGDQADRAMWSRFRDAVPVVDVFIDDGGHTHEQQCVALEEMLPHLRPGGVYICEDIHRSENRFAEAACGLVHALNAGDIVAGTGVDTCARTPFQAAIHSLHFYPFLLVIEKHDRPQAEFRAPLQGSEWRAPPDD